MSSPVLLPERKRSPLARLAAGLREIAGAIEEMEAPKPGPGPLSTVREAAADLHVSPDLLYREIKEGRIKTVRVGAAIRIAAEELEAYRRRRTR